MTIVAKLNIDNEGKYSYYIQKNEQNSLKGLLWGTGGSLLTAGSLSLTVATIGGVIAAAFASAGILTNDYSRNSIGGVTVPAIMGLATAAVIVDYLAVKFTGYCFSNAMHHLGPQYQIVRHKNGE